MIKRNDQNTIKRVKVITTHKEKHIDDDWQRRVKSAFLFS